MKRELAVLVGLTAMAGVASAAAQTQDPTPPAWAYPTNPPAQAGGGGARAAARTPDPTQLSLPGTALTFTRAQIRNGFGPSDWRPETHPTMPEVVASGRRPDVRACALCHYPNGQGRPENGPVAGLPAAYIIQQLNDFKSGARKSSEPRMGPPAAMVRLAQEMTAEEMATSAAYFSSFPYQKWVRVVEAETVPKLRIAGGMWVPADGTEPIGSRIVEVPEDLSRTELRDPISGFVAYVPPGTLVRGEDLAKTGAGTTTACGACHGNDLRGLGPVPPIAGRPASYLMRQLFDFKHGARAGAWSPLMESVVADLDEDDMMALAAYAAAQQP